MGTRFVSNEEMGKKCMKVLGHNFLRIKKEYIDKGDYATAYNEWNCALLDTNYAILSPLFQKFYMGGTFQVAADLLTKGLEAGDKKSIEFNTRLLFGCVKQQEMRENAGGGESD